MMVTVPLQASSHLCTLDVLFPPSIYINLVVILIVKVPPLSVYNLTDNNIRQDIRDIKHLRLSPDLPAFPLLL